MLTRYVVKANGEVIDNVFDENKAWKIANNYAYECANQDIPCFPKMEIVKETITNDEI